MDLGRVAAVLLAPMLVGLPLGLFSAVYLLVAWISLLAGKHPSAIQCSTAAQWLSVPLVLFPVWFFGFLIIGGLSIGMSPSYLRFLALMSVGPLLWAGAWWVKRTARERIREAASGE